MSGGQISPSSWKNPYDPGEQSGLHLSSLKAVAEILHTGLRTDSVPLVKLLDRADEKSGNISLVQRATVTWTPSNDALPEKIVLKLPTAVKMRQELARFMDKKTLDQLTEEESVIEKGHNAECNAYDFLESVPGLKLPRYFGHKFVKEPGNFDGFLILEDLTESSRVVDFLEGLSLNQVYQAVDSLAALHAYSLTNEEWKKRIGHVVPAHMIVKYMKMGENTCKFMQTTYSDAFPFTSSDLSLILNPLRYQFMSTLEDNKYPVVMHGDFWINNLLFGYDSQENKITDNLLAIIDWQSVHRGTIGEDLARLLATSISADVRRGSLNMIIGRYYTTLQGLLMEKNELVPFSMMEISEAYKLAFPYAAVFVTGMTAIQLDKAYASCTPAEKGRLVARAAAAVEDAIKIAREKPVPKLPEAED